jgi:CxxC motif-containing protein (DUF1111 family)
MKILRLLAVTILPMLLVVPMGVQGQQAAVEQSGISATEAVENNGFVDDATFDTAQEAFSEEETPADGLGPVYNHFSCKACHFQRGTGGSGVMAELRAGTTTNGVFTDHPGGSLIHSACAGNLAGGSNVTDADCEHVLTGTNTFALRRSLSIFGDGFVEATANQTLTAIRAAQPVGVQGTIINVPVVEVPGATRIGRFGWKDQQASLESFAGDAYLNEMGISNCVDGVCDVFGTDNTSNGNVRNDAVADPEDDGEDVENFTNFMRSLPAPAPCTNNAQTARGLTAFTAIGCATCHTASITTAQPGTAINGGAEIVGAATGNKTYRPFGDFLLHNIGTGDGIVQNGGAGTRNQVRTKPLWGTCTENRFLHGGTVFTITDAINAHAGQATTARNNFNAQGAATRADIIAFIVSR